jgi:hypothetical protein
MVFTNWEITTGIRKEIFDIEFRNIKGGQLYNLTGDIHRFLGDFHCEERQVNNKLEAIDHAPHLS